MQTLLKHDLVDALWLKIFPVTLGSGKKLFAEGTIPAAFKVTESTVTPKGMVVSYVVKANIQAAARPKLIYKCGGPDTVSA